jgi:DNA-binding transcriptional LysR family regulator/DNA-binding CsgD family transcriptional regulator
MDVRDLRTLLALVEPADEAGTCRPEEDAALVGRLQTELGVSLFTVQGGRWQPTVAGEHFLARAGDLLARLDAMRLGGWPPSGAGPSGPGPREVEDGRPLLTVGVLFPAAAELTALALAAFRDRWPGVTVRDVDIAGVGGERALTTGVVDVAFLWSPVADDRVTAIPLFEDTMAAVLPLNHPLAACSSLAARELGSQRYTATGSMSTQWRAASTVPDWRRRPDLATEVDTVVEAVAAITVGAAISIGPMSLQRFSPVAGLRCVPVRDLPRPTALLAHRRDDDRRLVREFLTVATAVAERHLSLVPGAVRAGGSARPVEVVEEVVEPLTARERDVLTLVASGLTAQAIGHSRGITTSTVRKHLQNIYRKLGASDRLVAVDRARRTGVLASPSR